MAFRILLMCVLLAFPVGGHAQDKVAPKATLKIVPKTGVMIGTGVTPKKDKLTVRREPDVKGVLEFDPKKTRPNTKVRIAKKPSAKTLQIRNVQTGLARLGYDAGPLDGVMGPRTKTAIRQFQASRGEPRTGVLTPAQAAVLVRVAGNVVPTAGAAPAATPSVKPAFSVGAGDGENAPLPTRSFGSLASFPPQDYRGYGILAFEAKATRFDRGRHEVICEAYVAAMELSETVGAAVGDQFVTVWPVEDDKLADIRALAQDASPSQICAQAIDNYGKSNADAALEAAKLAGFVDNGIGPYLFGWLPATKYGTQDALILVLDLSNVNNYVQAQSMLSEWKKDIQSDPALLEDGFSLEMLRRKIKRFADTYGEGFLALIG